MQIKIVMLSGGYDSTALLFWALRHPEWHVVAHHVVLVNYEQRWEPELQAVHAIQGHVEDRKIPCVFDYSRLELPDPFFCGRDIVHVGHIAAIVAQAHYFRHRKSSPSVEVFTGGTVEDGVHTQLANQDGIWKKTVIFETHFADWPNHETRPVLSVPFMGLPKSDIVQYIPKELMGRLWTCRIPRRMPDGSYQKCGECKSCLREESLRLC